LPTMMSENKSAIALKADCIRIVGRDNIIIGTTALGVVADGKPAHPNGIDIIANYNDINGLMANLQPMVKGNNLANLVVELVKKISKVQTNLVYFIQKQQLINNFFATHRHMNENTYFTKEPALVKLYLESTINEIEAETKHHIVFETELEALKGDYLTPSSTKYINSVYNRVN
jgi:hypothetical protein